MPNGIPRWIRVYDKEILADLEDWGVTRYTILFTGVYARTYDAAYYNMEICSDGSNKTIWAESTVLDMNTSNRGRHVGEIFKSLGRRISFRELPEVVQTEIVRLYIELWELDQTKTFNYWGSELELWKTGKHLHRMETAKLR